MRMTLLGDSQVRRLKLVWDSVDITTDSFAVGGLTTEQLKTVISRHCSEFNKTCFVLIGINDILQNIPLEKIKSNIRSIVKYLVKMNFNIFISTLPPTLHNSIEVQETIHAINILIQSFNTSVNVNVIYLNKHFKPFNMQDEHYYVYKHKHGKPDLIHLSSLGLRNLMFLICDAVAGQRPSAPPPPPRHALLPAATTATERDSTPGPEG